MDGENLPAAGAGRDRGAARGAATRMAKDGVSPAIDNGFVAAVKAGRLRFRAVMMTALSFLLGIVPLVVATGAGAGSRVALGTAVFGGMLAATVIGTLLIPVSYYVVQWLREKIKGSPPLRRTTVWPRRARSIINALIAACGSRVALLEQQIGALEADLDAARH